MRLTVTMEGEELKSVPNGIGMRQMEKVLIDSLNSLDPGLHPSIRSIELTMILDISPTKKTALRAK